MNQEPRTKNQASIKNRKLRIKSKCIFYFLSWSLLLGSWSFAAYAANYDIKEMTPAVRDALAGRQTRYSELQSAKRSGMAKENEQGYVDCSANSALCSAENHDRQVIYKTIAEQNDLGQAGLSQIQRAFAETIRERDSQ